MVKKLIRLPDVLNRINCSRSWLYDAVKRNLFPKPIRWGARGVAWIEDEVEGWLENKINDSRGTASHIKKEV